jgi:hypothetical protein
VTYPGSPAGSVGRDLAAANPNLAGSVGGGARSLRDGGGEGVNTVNTGATGSAVLLVNPGGLPGNDGSAGRTGGIPVFPLQGLSRDDVLIGGDGNDLPVGGDGTDILVGGFGTRPDRADDAPPVGADVVFAAWDLHWRVLPAALDEWGQAIGITRQPGEDAADGASADGAGAASGDAPLSDGGDYFTDWQG